MYARLSTAWPLHTTEHLSGALGTHSSRAASAVMVWPLNTCTHTLTPGKGPFGSPASAPNFCQHLTPERTWGTSKLHQHSVAEPLDADVRRCERCPRWGASQAMAGVLRGVAGSARCALQAQLSPCAGAHALPCTLPVLCVPCAEQRPISDFLFLTHCLRGGAYG